MLHQVRCIQILALPFSTTREHTAVSRLHEYRSQLPPAFFLLVPSCVPCSCCPSYLPCFPAFPHCVSCSFSVAWSPSTNRPKKLCLLTDSVPHPIDASFFIPGLTFTLLCILCQPLAFGNLFMTQSHENINPSTRALSSIVFSATCARDDSNVSRICQIFLTMGIRLCVATAM